MKTKIFILFSFLPTLLWGQKINSFDHLDSKWNVARTYTAGNQQNPNFVATTTTIFGYHGDTLINNEQWFKLYATKDSLFQNNLVYQGLTRSENNRVLYLDATNQLDTLYDFNLNLGDSVLFNLYGMYPEKLPVTSIDSIQLNGEFYKRFKFAEPSIIAFDELNEIWIDGIGSIHGPLFPNFPVKFSQEMPDLLLLTCTTVDNLHIYQNSSYSDCYINIVLGLESQEALNFKIYPNPFKDKIFIGKSNQESFGITVVNSIGQVVFRKRIATNREIIDLSELNDGIYLLKISNNKITSTTILIKKH